MTDDAAFIRSILANNRFSTWDKDTLLRVRHLATKAENPEHKILLTELLTSREKHLEQDRKNEFTIYGIMVFIVLYAIVYVSICDVYKVVKCPNW